MIDEVLSLVVVRDLAHHAHVLLERKAADQHFLVR